MISFNSLLENTNPRVRSFRMLQDTKCKRQIDDQTFVEEIGVIAKKGEVYDGEMMLKRDNNIYLFLGYDDRLGYDLYIPLSWDSSLDKGRIVNITEA
jgi:hypothetical protein